MIFIWFNLEGSFQNPRSSLTRFFSSHSISNPSRSIGNLFRIYPEVNEPSPSQGCPLTRPPVSLWETGSLSAPLVLPVVCLQYLTAGRPISSSAQSTALQEHTLRWSPLISEETQSTYNGLRVPKPLLPMALVRNACSRATPALLAQNLCVWGPEIYVNRLAKVCRPLHTPSRGHDLSNLSSHNHPNLTQNPNPQPAGAPDPRTLLCSVHGRHVADTQQTSGVGE